MHRAIVICLLAFGLISLALAGVTFIHMLTSSDSGVWWYTLGALALAILAFSVAAVVTRPRD